jgi:transcription elongation factor
MSLMVIRSRDRRPEKGSWVRLSRGPNKGDLGYVMRSDVNCDLVTVVVVPRIDLCYPQASRKRKRTFQRPPAKLFDVLKVSHVYGKDMVSIRNDRHIFQKKKYYKGLLELNLFTTQMLVRVDEASLVAVRPFVEAGVVSPGEALAVVSHEICARLRPGDAVRITSSEHAGCRGILVIKQGDVAFVDLDDINSQGSDAQKPDILLQVPITALQRIFRVGDKVRVDDGPAGYIVEVGDGCLSLVEEQTKEVVRSLSPFIRQRI